MANSGKVTSVFTSRVVVALFFGGLWVVVGVAWAASSVGAVVGERGRPADGVFCLVEHIIVCKDLEVRTCNTDECEGSGN